MSEVIRDTAEVRQMVDRAVERVRAFCTSWAGPPEAILENFADDAIWIDGARGVHDGKRSIRRELLAQRIASGPIGIEIKSLLSDGHLVLVERLDTMRLDEMSFPLAVAGAFEVNDDGLIIRWQDYFDEGAYMASLPAAGVSMDTLAAMGEAYERELANHDVA